MGDKRDAESDWLAGRMLALSLAHEAEPAVAYLCAWGAVTRLVSVISWRAGIRPQFSLRQNGTLRTRKVGDHKLPELIPAGEDHQWRAALAMLAPADGANLLGHPNVRALASLRPALNGRPVTKDGYGQRPTGVLDIAMTRDVRYPVWHTVETKVLAARDVNAQPGAWQELLWQVSLLLRTVHSNLLVAQDADPSEARLGLPLARLLAEGLRRAAGTEDTSGPQES